AGGGSIPLEAMRLDCNAAAIDINPVAWFVLKCTLEYPQRLASQRRRLPSFIVKSRPFLEDFLKQAKGIKGRELRRSLAQANENSLPSLDAELPWHVRAWGWWVLQRAREDLAPFFPVVDGRQVSAYLWARTAACKNCRATFPLLKTKWLCTK